MQSVHVTCNPEASQFVYMEEIDQPKEARILFGELAEVATSLFGNRPQDGYRVLRQNASVVCQF